MLIANGKYALVGGRQINAKVSAPPALESFAKLEEARIEHGMFPINLTEIGRIRQAANAGHASEIDKAVDLAMAHIRDGGQNAEQKNAAFHFLRSLQQSAGQATSQMPQDLFFPDRLNHSHSRPVPLPRGISGKITIDFAAVLNDNSTLLKTAERAVTTTVEASSRTSIERWILAPA